MGAWSLTWASGSISDECALSKEATVRVRDPVVRALGLHGAAGVVSITKVGILTAGFPTVVVPSVLISQGSAWIAGMVILVVHAHDTTVHVAVGGEFDRHRYRIHRCRHAVERLLREVDEQVVVPVQRRWCSSIGMSDGWNRQRSTRGGNAYRRRFHHLEEVTHCFGHSLANRYPIVALLPQLVGRLLDDGHGEAVPALGADGLNRRGVQPRVPAHHLQHFAHGAGLQVIGCGF